MLACCAAGMLFTSCQKKTETKPIGALSYLRYSEDDFATLFESSGDLLKVLGDEGYIKTQLPPPAEKLAKPAVRYYDSLESLLMALKSGEIGMISSIPQSTAYYLCKQDDKLQTVLNFDIPKIFDSDNKNSFSKIASRWLSDGFSFMLMEKNTELRDQMNTAIDSMEKDGTILALVREHIGGPITGAQPQPIILENKPGRKTIKIAVTGDLPPMDYIAPDGTFAGFNTAILAEIGKRLDVNIAMVQVANAGRAAALASGTVDVVFWTRASALPTDRFTSKEQIETARKAGNGRFDEKESAALESLINSLKGEDYQKHITLEKKDMPDGTIITRPYHKDAVSSIILKK